MAPYLKLNLKTLCMKSLLLAFTLLGSVFCWAQEDQSLDWLTDLDQAKQLAKENKTPVLVYFTGSDWCTPCKMLKEDFFESSAFMDRSDEFVLLMIDYPRRIDIIAETQMEHNKRVIAVYNKEKVFPKLVIINSKGKQKAEISGYSQLRDPSGYFRFLDKNL